MNRWMMALCGVIVAGCGASSDPVNLGTDRGPTSGTDVVTATDTVTATTDGSDAFSLGCGRWS